MKQIARFLLVKSIGLYLNFYSFIRRDQAVFRAYRYFSEPRVGKLNKQQLPKILQQAEVETLKYDGDDIQIYRWQGNDHKILLVHGWESNAARWEQLVPYLQKRGSTIIAIDAPAHGLSSGIEFTVPRYAEYIDVAIKKFSPDAIVGHSMGGVASIYHQYQSKTQVKKLVLLGVPSEFQTLLDNFTKLLGLNSRLTQGLEQYFLDRFSIKTREFSGKIFGSKLAHKGIIAHDTSDSVVAFSESKLIAETWQHAEFIETKGLGHSMHDDELYLKISRFLSLV